MFNTIYQYILDYHKEITYIDTNSQIEYLLIKEIPKNAQLCRIKQIEIEYNKLSFNEAFKQYLSPQISMHVIFDQILSDNFIQKYKEENTLEELMKLKILQQQLRNLCFLQSCLIKIVVCTQYCTRANNQIIHILKKMIQLIKNFGEVKNLKSRYLVFEMQICWSQISYSRMI
ncbi:unnamed protein product [Paramecium sonneborni]|uniref:Uncharacterized protein n=1 Tax=Paramecium sonneborni TaxID=65129 RepID=A0A8S1L7C7_9CILI|nr:unnamed protein product [Paramecium sonneborni]